MRHERRDHKIAIALIVLVFLAAIGTPIFIYAKKYYAQKHPIASSSAEKILVDANPATTPVDSSTKEKITTAPPKHTASGAGTSVKTNPDGSTNVTLSEASGCPADSAQVAALGAGSSSPSQIRFLDQTGQNGALPAVLKNYVTSSLLYSNELPYMYEIIISNAGATGWEGQYCGSYSTDSSGKIVSSFGFIILNTYYHQSDPQFNDYMKLVLSHEYGHHYTLWHKWIDYNLPAGTRFPDSYYTTRPLSKTATATDYSLGWGNCELEIMAEDYSYTFSGYGYDAMAGAFGYPSSAMRQWFINFPKTVSQSLPATDNPPTVSITAPTDGATVSGTFQISATAADDHNVSKVEFFVDGVSAGTVTSAPYQISFGSASLPNGSHTIKATATDSANQPTDNSIIVTFNNSSTDSVAPVITFSTPTSPYSWDSSVQNLNLSANATDNVGVTKMEFYIDGSLVATRNRDSLSGTWAYSNVGPGTYTVTAKAYDAAGNVGTASVTINKS